MAPREISHPLTVFAGSRIIALPRIGAWLLATFDEIYSRRTTRAAFARLSERDFRDIGLVEADIDRALSGAIDLDAFGEILHSARCRSANW